MLSASLLRLSGYGVRVVAGWWPVVADREACVPRLTREDFENLLAFRTSLRRFQRWSEDQAHAAGLTHVQHQLLVAVKGHPGAEPPTISDLAGYLLQRHHSTVELVDRAAMAGLVERVSDATDGRLVRVRLTDLGQQRLDELTPAHLAELRGLARSLNELLERSNGAGSGPARQASSPRRQP